jgi:two-component system phosphate regulon response regulator PhoB
MDGLILVVEDEADLRSNLLYNLKKEGYEIREAENGREALQQALREPHPDLVVLDLMLPDMPGTEVCRQLRSRPAIAHVPVLILTALGEEVDRVVGFEVGADDYVTKPFSVRELMLRIRALLRRSQNHREQPGLTLHAGVLRIEPDSHRVWVEGRELRLTALEFKLLLTLFERRGRVQSRAVLLDEVWGITADVNTRTVDTHVRRLRSKLGDASAYIETLRGVGYRFRGPQGA